MPSGETSPPAAFGRDGKYETRRVVGRGSTGVVYEAWDNVIKRRVAVKAVHLGGKSAGDVAEVLARFPLEAQVTARLQFPGIVNIHDYGANAEVAFIVMEFVDGGTLKERIGADGVRPLARAGEIMRQILDALDHCHRNGVVHRDIKPGNVMLTDTEIVKLTDFGIVQVEDGDQTELGTLVGTPAYMAPEQFTRRYPVDHRADIYASGVVFYEMLTGSRPFKGDTAALSYKIVNDEPVAPSRRTADLPPHLDAVVLKALAKVPDERFSSAREFAEAISLALSQSADRGRRPPLIEAPVNLRWLAVGGGGALVAVVALVAWLLPRTGQTPAQTPALLAPPAVQYPVAGTVATAVPPPSPPPTVLPPIPDAIAQLPCSTVRASIGANPPMLSLHGIIGDGDAKAAMDEIVGRFKDGAVRNTVQVFPPSVSFCHVADIVHAVTGNQDDAGTIHLSIRDGATRLKDGTPIELRVVMPDFPDGRLLLDYLSRLDAQPPLPDGSLTTHVLQNTPVSPVHGTGEQVDPGSGTKNDNVGKAGQPFGFDMVIAIASSEPLFAATRTGKIIPGRRSNESSDAYLNELQVAIAALKGKGGMVSADALVLETVAQ